MRILAIVGGLLTLAATLLSAANKGGPIPEPNIQLLIVISAAAAAIWYIRFIQPWICEPIREGITERVKAALENGFLEEAWKQSRSEHADDVSFLVSFMSNCGKFAIAKSLARGISPEPHLLIVVVLLLVPAWYFAQTISGRLDWPWALPIGYGFVLILVSLNMTVREGVYRAVRLYLEDAS